MLACFRFRVSDGLRIAINAGPYAAYKVSQPDEVDAEGFDMGVAAGLDFLLGRHWVVGGICEYGLTKVVKLAAKSPHNINYGLNFGCRF